MVTRLVLQPARPLTSLATSSSSSSSSSNCWSIAAQPSVASQREDEGTPAQRLPPEVLLLIASQFEHECDGMDCKGGSCQVNVQGVMEVGLAFALTCRDWSAVGVHLLQKAAQEVERLAYHSGDPGRLASLAHSRNAGYRFPNVKQLTLGPWTRSQVYRSARLRAIKPGTLLCLPALEQVSLSITDEYKAGELVTPVPRGCIDEGWPVLCLSKTVSLLRVTGCDGGFALALFRATLPHAVFIQLQTSSSWSPVERFSTLSSMQRHATSVKNRVAELIIDKRDTQDWSSSWLHLKVMLAHMPELTSLSFWNSARHEHHDELGHILGALPSSLTEFSFEWADLYAPTTFRPTPLHGTSRGPRLDELVDNKQEAHERHVLVEFADRPLRAWLATQPHSLRLRRLCVSVRTSLGRLSWHARPDLIGACSATEISLVDNPW